MDAGRFELCYTPTFPCVCTQDGCAAALNHTIQFDFVIEGTELAGKLLFPRVTPENPSGEIRLRKVR
jgi:hypothetical protein